MPKNSRSGRGHDALTARRVLIVEDNHLLAEELRDIMALAGCAVIGPISSAAEVLDLVGREPIDGVLLDVNLSDSTSHKVAKELRRRRIPFVVVTGYEHQYLEPELRNAAYVGKPVKPDELLERARREFG